MVINPVRPERGDAARLIERGQSAERAGRRQEARHCFEAALHSVSGPDAAAQGASILRWIARTYMLDGSHDAAMDCVGAALAIAQATSDAASEGHAINVQAAIHWAQGELDRAESLYRVARARALSVSERALVAMTSNNLGIIANIRGDLPEALHQYSVALENYRALQRPMDVRNALNNMGRLHTDLRRWSDAEAVYAEAVEITNTLGDHASRIGLEVNVAEMWVARHEAERAAGALDIASRLSEEAGDDAWLAHIAKLRGMLRREAGSPAEADQHLTRAVELAEARQDLLLLAEALRERAELYRTEGRNRESLQNLNRAHRLFTQLRAKRQLANVDQSVVRLEEDFLNVVRRWGESIEAKDRYTQGHCVRVADLACAIAARCGFDAQVLFWFRIGALLHDVGKLVVPSEILNKPGKLEPDEWALMRSHPTAGIDMLAGIDFPWDVRPIIQSHHERWDGKGYPHALRGEEIPLSARILAIADVYDALTSLRSYKASLTHDAAMEIMRRDIGRAFDPAVFAEFESVMAAGVVPDAPSVGHAAPDVGLDRVSLELSSTDHTTGLPLRGSMERIAEQAFADRETTNNPVSILVLEVQAESSQWQRRTDAHRHRVLRRIARDLRRETRLSDFVARMSDHQFMALLPGSSARQARAIMARVHLALRGSSPAGVKADDLTPLVNLHVVTAPMDGGTASQLLESALARGAPGCRRDQANRAG